MEYIPNLAIRDEMLAAIGLDSMDDLFADIPKAVRAGELNLPAGRAEQDVLGYLHRILSLNQSTDKAPQFAGGTLKEHFIPAFVGHILSRQEFYTSYTPYQAELSQGTLQALFEFQSMLGDVTGLPVANASMYDASTAMAEAALMAARVTGRDLVLAPEHLAPEKRSTLENYCAAHGLGVRSYGFDGATGATDVGAVQEAIGDETAAVYIESPNFFGVWETAAAEISAAAHDVGALAIHGFDLSSLGIAKPPGELGADIAVGDGTTFCFPPSLGGPQLGLFACREELARRMPGRIIGASRDRQGGRAYCMTLQTREQHIRREKATSNICTNQSLLAVGAGAYLTALGPHGLRELGLLNAQAARRLAARVEAETGWRGAFEGANYNEITLVGPVDAVTLCERAGSHGLTVGYPASLAVPALPDHLVTCTTEIHTDQDHAVLVAALREATP